MLKKKSPAKKTAILIVTELINRFPDLDFRFNLTESNNVIRYKISGKNSKIHEIDLSQFQNSMLFETILDIKEDCKMFDA